MPFATLEIRKSSVISLAVLDQATALTRLLGQAPIDYGRDNSPATASTAQE
jgi:hypothetical protein